MAYGSGRWQQRRARAPWRQDLGEEPARCRLGLHLHVAADDRPTTPVRPIRSKKEAGSPESLGGQPILAVPKSGVKSRSEVLVAVSVQLAPTPYTYTLSLRSALP